MAFERKRNPFEDGTISIFSPNPNRPLWPLFPGGNLTTRRAAAAGGHGPRSAPHGVLAGVLADGRPVDRLPPLLLHPPLLPPPRRPRPSPPTYARARRRRRSSPPPPPRLRDYWGNRWLSPSLFLACLLADGVASLSLSSLPVLWCAQLMVGGVCVCVYACAGDVGAGQSGGGGAGAGGVPRHPRWVACFFFGACVGISSNTLCASLVVDSSIANGPNHGVVVALISLLLLDFVKYWTCRSLCSCSSLIRSLPIQK